MLSGLALRSCAFSVRGDRHAYRRRGREYRYGQRIWSNPGNIIADDTSYATTANAQQRQPDEQTTCRATNFALNVPAGATITGIQVEIMRAASGATVVDNVVSLVKGGAITGDNKATATAWPIPPPTPNMQTATYGGPADLWGTTWTPAEINAADFGVALSARRTAGSVTASVDYFRVTVTYTPPSYTITSTAGAGGSISPSGSTTVTAGGSQTYTITPDTGYHVADVLVDGVSQGPVTSYTFSNVTANHTIAATFAIDTYTITTSSGANGTITPPNPTVNHGADQSFLIVPDAGYRIADVLVDGVSQGPVGSYTFSNVTSAGHTIAATFAATTYTITSSAGPNGSISPLGATTVPEGGSQTYTITPDIGYHIADVVVDGTSQGPIGSYTFSNVTAPHTISATFAHQDLHAHLHRRHRWHHHRHYAPDREPRRQWHRGHRHAEPRLPLRQLV